MSRPEPAASAQPSTAPRGNAGVIRHVVVPAVVDVLVPGAVWLFYLNQADAPITVAFAYVPDIALLMLAITVLGIGWGTIRTLRTIAAVPSRSDTKSVAGPAPAA